ncbi:hypothetical protein BJX76DRAFT_353987 [Aspergillus varians]
MKMTSEIMASMTLNILAQSPTGVHRGVFGDKMPWYFTFLSIFLALPVAMIGIRGLAESDFNAGSGLAVQLILASPTPSSNPNSAIINILSAAIANGGASQSGDLALDLKVG